MSSLATILILDGIHEDFTIPCEALTDDAPNCNFNPLILYMNCQIINAFDFSNKSNIGTIPYAHKGHEIAFPFMSIFFILTSFQN